MLQNLNFLFHGQVLEFVCQVKKVKQDSTGVYKRIYCIKTRTQLG